MRKLMVVAMFLGACADDPAPSCQQAVGHYYAKGCAFFDLSKNPPAPYTEAQSISDCKATNAAVPDQCRSEFDDLMSCLDSVRGGSTAGCDCSREQDALFGCK